VAKASSLEIHNKHNATTSSGLSLIFPWISNAVNAYLHSKVERVYSKHWKSSEFDLKGDWPDTRLTAKITDHSMRYFLNETMVYRRAFKPQHFAYTSDHFGAPKRPRKQRGDFRDGNLRSTSRDNEAGRNRQPESLTP
jgi:hypothetical protein